MPKVYITNKGSHDYSDAERFGNIIYLSQGKINRYATNTMVREFLPIIEKSSSDDYILVTGLTVMNSIACGLFAQKHERLNLLLFRSKRDSTERDRYVERIVVFERRYHEI